LTVNVESLQQNRMEIRQITNVIKSSKLTYFNTKYENWNIVNVNLYFVFWGYFVMLTSLKPYWHKKKWLWNWISSMQILYKCISIYVLFEYVKSTSKTLYFATYSARKWKQPLFTETSHHLHSRYTRLLPMIICVLAPSLLCDRNWSSLKRTLNCVTD
jgi:hypothetical protein